jgi:hypothetical protein
MDTHQRSIHMTSSAFRHAARRLVRAPAFALAAVLTLALGIAGTTAVFTVVNGVLFRPLPYRNAEQLVDLSHTLAIGGGMHVDTDVGAYRTAAVNLRGDGAAPERIDAAVAGSNAKWWESCPRVFASQRRRRRSGYHCSWIRR